ncbi:MAG: response regulator transcription factor [Caproiciproducens sp.]|nr:response regulator transcription factor [Caproiciproducens sp.]
MNKTSILIVEDDKAVRNLLTTTMKANGYAFHTAETGESAILQATSTKPDVVILDLGLPDIDGVDIIKKIRSWTNNPIIVVSARGEDKDKIDALDAGADDYLTKPFSIDELLARIRVAVRKMNYDNSAAAKDSAVFQNGGLKIDYAAGCVFIDGTEIHLTPIEYKLLCLLAKNVGKVLTHNYMLHEVWVNTSEYDTPSLRVFMATLRKKIEKNPSEPLYIQTHIGVGYRMIRIQGENEA